LEEDLVFTYGDIRSTADSAYYSLPDDLLTLEGRPKVTDGRNRIMAREIRLDQKNHLLLASGHVKTVTFPEEKDEEEEETGSLMSFTDDPILFISDRMKLDYRTKDVWFEDHVKVSQGDNEIYARTVTLDKSSERMEARGDVKSIFKPPEKAGARVGGGLLDSGEAVYFWSDTMSINQGEDIIRFVDNVRVLQGENTITTREMMIFNKEKRFIARGGVKSVYNLQDDEAGKKEGKNNLILTTARIMAYDESEDKIVYLQDVQVKEAENRVMSADQMEVFLSGEKDPIRQIRLKGNVRFRRNAQEGRGDEADYFPSGRKSFFGAKMPDLKREDA